MTANEIAEVLLNSRKDYFYSETMEEQANHHDQIALEFAMELKFTEPSFNQTDFLHRAGNKP